MPNESHAAKGKGLSLVRAATCTKFGLDVRTVIPLLRANNESMTQKKGARLGDIFMAHRIPPLKPHKLAFPDSTSTKIAANDHRGDAVPRSLIFAGKRHPYKLADKQQEQHHPDAFNGRNQCVRLYRGRIHTPQLVSLLTLIAFGFMRASRSFQNSHPIINAIHQYRHRHQVGLPPNPAPCRNVLNPGGMGSGIAATNFLSKSIHASSHSTLNGTEFRSSSRCPYYRLADVDRCWKNKTSSLKECILRCRRPNQTANIFIRG
ncbi:hypothetical protein IW262DRAFT_1302347 [Armillaria fumosa]|nr:hypothetical protein IW262DRAFT_1302347 [Armillaria fumosa]